jgi:hypothetical protein
MPVQLCCDSLRGALPLVAMLSTQHPARASGRASAFAGCHRSSSSSSNSSECGVVDGHVVACASPPLLTTHRCGSARVTASRGVTILVRRPVSNICCRAPCSHSNVLNILKSTFNAHVSNHKLRKQQQPPGTRHASPCQHQKQRHRRLTLTTAQLFSIKMTCRAAQSTC